MKNSGDGIMSAIDFSLDIQRQEYPKGDRVNVVLSGKFLPYKPTEQLAPGGAPVIPPENNREHRDPFKIIKSLL